MGAGETLGRITRREVSCVEVAKETLRRIDAVDGEIHAFLHVDREGALGRAEALDRHLAAGKPPLPLHGLPVAVKDNLCTKGTPTTCGSRILGNFVPPYDAHVVERLHAAGAVVVGKTNMDEFAMGSSTENSAFGPTRNPRDPERVPGGSSGGSAAAVAAGMVDLALGSDTGGSIRQPAAFCGIVGLKPTYGRVSRYGLVAFASSLDQVGPMASDVEGAAMLLSVIAGRDERDATAADQPVPLYKQDPDIPMQKLRIGVIPGENRNFSYTRFGPFGSLLDDAKKHLEEQGHTFHEIELPGLAYGIPTYYLVATSEASSNLGRYDGVLYGRRAGKPTDMLDLESRSRAEGFGAEVKRRILLGTFALSRGYYDAYYLKAQKVRTLILQEFLGAFQEVDLLFLPTTPTLPFLLGERTEDPLMMYFSDFFTVGANLAGLPAISVNCGWSDDKPRLPVGLQFVAPPFEEARLFAAARAVERTASPIPSR